MINNFRKTKTCMTCKYSVENSDYDSLNYYCDFDGDFDNDYFFYPWCKVEENNKEAEEWFDSHRVDCDNVCDDFERQSQP